MTQPHHFAILRYGAFSDFPHGIYLEMFGKVIHLDSEFDEEADDYRNYFEVSVVVNAVAQDLTNLPVFRSKDYPNHYLGRLLVQDVSFDESRRKSLASSKLEEMFEGYLSSHSQQA